MIFRIYITRIFLNGWMNIDNNNKNVRFLRGGGERMTQEELVNRLEKVGIKGQWINSDKYGFSRIYEFAINEQIIQIEWYANYSTVMIGNAHFWFDNILLHSSYPMQGEWIEFSFRGEHPLHIKVK